MNSKKTLGLLSALTILLGVAFAKHAHAQAVTAATRVIQLQQGHAQLIPGVSEFGPHTSSEYGVGVSYLVTDPSAPILVRFSRHLGARTEVGFKGFRDPTSATFTVNGVDYHEDFSPGAIAEILVAPPPGGWFAGGLDLSTTAFDGTTGADGTPHRIYRTIIGAFYLIP